MQDQVENLKSRNIKATSIKSGSSQDEIIALFDHIKFGGIKFLYISPERLQATFIQQKIKELDISFVAIDEAHCISEWGHDFRPEYRNLKHIIKAIDNVPVICLTATATEKVQEDILKTLGIMDANRFKASFNRANLFYEVRPKTKEVEKDIIRFVKQREGKSGIIYCLSRKKVEEISQILQVNGIKAVPYHAGLDAKTRVRHQDMFLMEDCDVVVATIAFGISFSVCNILTPKDSILSSKATFSSLEKNAVTFSATLGPTSFISVKFSSVQFCKSCTFLTSAAKSLDTFFPK